MSPWDGRASVAARSKVDPNSLMIAEKVGRSLKLHIQQYFIRLYLKPYRLGKTFDIVALCRIPVIVVLRTNLICIASFIRTPLSSSINTFIWARTESWPLRVAGYATLTEGPRSLLVVPFGKNSEDVEAQTGVPTQDMEGTL